nr:ORF104 [uncultured bacterium]
MQNVNPNLLHRASSCYRSQRAIDALQVMEQSGIVVMGWKGWLRYPDGKLGHSLRHQGTAATSQLTQTEMYAWLRSTMYKSQVEHHHHPEASGSELLFCITAQA